MSESVREDKFLDLSLTVKNEIDKVYNDSIEKALKNYIQPEVLSGDNQYCCEHCADKQDALKGLSFKELPYVLVLQLKRFDLDYRTLQRIKLNDEVRFPQVLNMNPLMKGNADELVEENWAHEAPEAPESAVLADLTPADLFARRLSFKLCNAPDYIAHDEDKKTLKLDDLAKKKHIERRSEIRKQERAKLISQYRQEGENIYELYSIMIHSGSALGGHYYAYIKCFETERWYNFNDSSVKEVDEKDLEKAFGGSSKGLGYWSSSYSTNGYLLMYRKVDESRNIPRIEREEVPHYVLEELEKEKERERQEELERLEQSKYMKLRVYYSKEEKIIECKKDALMVDFKAKAMEDFALTHMQPEDVRVRGYSPHYDVFQEIFLVQKSLEDLHLHSYRILGLETKQPTEQWEAYDPDKIIVKVNLWDDALGALDSAYEEMTKRPVRVIVDKRGTLKQMMESFQEQFGVPVDEQRILKRPYMMTNSTAEIISFPVYLHQSLTYSRVTEGAVLFLERKKSDDRSLWQQLLSKEAYKYTIKFNHPEAQPSAMGHYESRESVALDSSRTLQELKAKIAERISMHADTFILKRSGQYGSELKDLGLTLKQANLMNNSILFLEKGRPVKPNELRIILFLAQPLKADECDGSLFSYEELSDLYINTSSSVKELKDTIAQLIQEKLPELDAVPSRLRLREKFYEKIGKVLPDSENFRQYHGVDKKQYAVQVLAEDAEALRPNEVLVAVKRFSPDTWELSAVTELAINKHLHIHDFGEKLSEFYAIPHEHLEIVKITHTYHFMRGDLELEHFTRTAKNYFYLSGNPWFINADGTLFVVKDSTELQREMTAEEKLRFKNKTVQGYVSWKYESPKEQSVKITVKIKQKQGKDSDQEDSKANQ